MHYVSCTKCDNKDLELDGYTGEATHLCKSCQRKADASKGEDIDTYGLDNIVCPYCGCEVGESDSLEMSDCIDYGADICEECGRKFEWNSNVTIYFSTSKIEDQEIPTDE